MLYVRLIAQHLVRCCRLTGLSDTALTEHQAADTGTCRYEDGDGEDVDWDELQRVLDPPDDGDVQPSHKKQPKKRIKREPVDEDAPGTSSAAERAAKPRVRKPPKHHPASGEPLQTQCPRLPADTKACLLEARMTSHTFITTFQPRPTRFAEERSCRSIPLWEQQHAWHCSCSQACGGGDCFVAAMQMTTRRSRPLAGRQRRMASVMQSTMKVSSSAAGSTQHPLLQAAVLPCGPHTALTPCGSLLHQQQAG